MGPLYICAAVQLAAVSHSKAQELAERKGIVHEATSALVGTRSAVLSSVISMSAKSPMRSSRVD